MNNQLSSDYDLIIKANETEFPYNSLEKEDIKLRRHEELAQGNYTQPQISEDGKYIGVLCKGNNEDLVYIYKSSNLSMPLYEYNGSTIHSFTFTTINSGFIIVYSDKIVYFKLSLGHMVKKFKTNASVHANMINEPIPKPLLTSSASGGRYFIIGYETHFEIWDIITGNEVNRIEDTSVQKFYSQNFLLSNSNEGEIKILKINNGAVLKTFRIRDINSNDDVLYLMLSEYLDHLFYLTRQGFFCFIFKTGIINCVMKYDNNTNFVPVEGYISFDCQYFIVTNKEEILIWSEGGESNSDNGNEPLRIYKEKFKDYYIDFELSVLLTVDDVELSMINYTKENPQELSVLFRANPTQFDSFQFSPDGLVLLTIINEFNAILWNCETGSIIKEWYHEIEQWSRAVEMVPETSLLAVIATKSSENCIKLWSYSNGKEVMSLLNFNCYSMCFSPEGNLLSAGSKYGYEIARLWNITENNYNSYYNFNYPNINTIVSITGKELNYLIAHSVNQNPIMFHIESTNMLHTFKCPNTFTRLDSISTSRDNSLFVSNGIDNNKERIAVCWNTEDGSLVNPLDSYTCSLIEFSKDGRYLLTKGSERGSSERKQKTLEISDVRSQMNELTCDASALSTLPNESRFLQDSLSQISVFKNANDSNADILLTDIKSGELIAAINYVNRSKLFSKYYIGYESEENNLVFRHISLNN